MKKIVLASANAHKIKEFNEMLKDYEIVSMADIGYFDDIEETGSTFFENSFIKAKAIRDYLRDQNLDYMVLADDSGLCVNALNGEPGVYSARYGGDHDDEANRQAVIKKLQDKTDRSAYFVCTIVLLDDDNIITAEGKTYGTITERKYGENGFCYDLIFYSNDLEKTFGQASSEEKNSVSHRRRAISDLLGTEE